MTKDLKKIVMNANSKVFSNSLSLPLIVFCFLILAFNFIQTFYFLPTILHIVFFVVTLMTYIICILTFSGKKVPLTNYIIFIALICELSWSYKQVFDRQSSVTVYGVIIHFSVFCLKLLILSACTLIANNRVKN